MVSNLFNNFYIGILSLLLHIGDTTSHYRIFLLIASIKMAEKAETCRRSSTCHYIVVINYIAVAGHTIYGHIIKPTRRTNFSNLF